MRAGIGLIVFLVALFSVVTIEQEKKKVLIAVVVVSLLAISLSVDARAQSWGRGGAYTGASPGLEYRDGRGGAYRPYFREPSWSAALTKCAYEQARNAARQRAAMNGRRHPLADSSDLKLRADSGHVRA